MGTSSSMAEAAAKVGKAVDSSVLSAMAKAGGMAAKKAGLEAAAAKLGGDRRMSGMRRGTLGVGFDAGAGSSVTVNYRPGGLWKLADEGRKGSKVVRRRGVVFRTPAGPRWSFRSGPSRGTGVLKDAQRRAQAEAPRAAASEFQKQLGRIF